MPQQVNCIKEVALAFARMQYNAPIMEVTIYDHEQIGFPEVREIRYVAERLSGFKPYFQLLELGENVRITQEGKKAAINLRDNPHKKASAIIVNSPAQEEDVDQIINLAEVPTRSFRRRDKALAWLQSLSLYS